MSSSHVKRSRCLLFTANDVGHAYHTGNSEDIFDAGYGTVALVAGAFVPPLGAGMAIAKVGSALIAPSESNVLDQAAQPDVSLSTNDVLQAHSVLSRLAQGSRKPGFIRAGRGNVRILQCRCR